MLGFWGGVRKGMGLGAAEVDRGRHCRPAGEDGFCPRLVLSALSRHQVPAGRSSVCTANAIVMA